MLTDNQYDPPYTEQNAKTIRTRAKNKTDLLTRYGHGGGGSIGKNQNLLRKIFDTGVF